MGKIDLYHDKNICKGIAKNITHINGLRKTSESPSEIWLIEFRPGVTFNGKPVDKAVMKIFFSATQRFPPEQRYLEANTYGLEYEEKVYTQIINPLIINLMCPYFITSFTSTVCSYDDMIRILNTKFKDRNTTIGRFNRNFKAIWQETDKRVSINDAGGETTDSYPIKSRNYSFIMLREFTPKHESLYYYVKGLDIKSIHDNTDFWLVLYQIAVGLYALELSKLSHNDFHPSNCMIEFLDSPFTISQAIKNNGDWIYYNYTSNIRAVIFDFDRSYSPRFGSNLALSNLCSENDGYQCNKFIKGRDITQLFCNLFKEMKAQDTPLQDMKLLVSQITDNYDEFKDFSNNKYCTSNYVPHIYPLPDIINNLAKKANIIITQHKPTTDDDATTFTLDPDNFI